jgi:hypothetical protein
MKDFNIDVIISEWVMPFLQHGQAALERSRNRQLFPFALVTDLRIPHFRKVVNSTVTNRSFNC